MNFLSLIFCPVTPKQMQSDAYEPTMHMHVCAQKFVPTKELAIDVFELSNLAYG